MSEPIESTGRTVEEAISEALLQLGARRDEVEVEVLDEGKAGFLGVFGGKPARVIVRRKPRSRGRQRSGQGRGNGRARQPASRSTRGRNRQPTETQREPAAEAANQREDKSARTATRPARKAAAPNGAGRSGPTPLGQKGRGAGRKGRGRSDQNTQQRRALEREAPRGNVRERDILPDKGRKKELEAIPVGDAIRATTMAEALRGVGAHEAPAHLKKITSKLMALSGFPCRCEVQEGEYHLVKIITDDSSAGVLIGRHGSTVDALEHIVERMASQAVGDRVNMNLDVNNYRRRREENLSQRVLEIAQRVVSTGKEVHLEPLCARERRIVHLQVVDISGVRTYTIANSNGKHVVVAIDEGGEGANKTTDSLVGDSNDDAGNIFTESTDRDSADRVTGGAADIDLSMGLEDDFDGDSDDLRGNPSNDVDGSGAQARESDSEGWLDDRYFPGDSTQRE